MWIAPQHSPIRTKRAASWRDKDAHSPEHEPQATPHPAATRSTVLIKAQRRGQPASKPSIASRRGHANSETGSMSRVSGSRLVDLSLVGLYRSSGMPPPIREDQTRLSTSRGTDSTLENVRVSALSSLLGDPPTWVDLSALLKYNGGEDKDLALPSSLGTTLDPTNSLCRAEHVSHGLTRAGVSSTVRCLVISLGRCHR
jgi:hypothetical protein